MQPVIAQIGKAEAVIKMDCAFTGECKELYRKVLRCGPGKHFQQQRAADPTSAILWHQGNINDTEVILASIKNKAASICSITIDDRPLGTWVVPHVVRRLGVKLHP